MISLFEHFCSNLGIFISTNEFYDKFGDIESELKKDDSDYVIVDGEEGDYGIIKYYTNDGFLFAIEINRGGDDIDVEFTSVARLIFGNMIEELISDKLKNMELYEENE